MIENDVVVTADEISEKTVDATVKSTVTISAMSRTLTDGADGGRVTKRSGVNKMAEYIDRQAAIKAIEGLHDCYNGFSDTYDKACIVGALEEIPSADVEPVRHGRWIDAEIQLESGGSMPIQACSLCKTFYPLSYTGGGHRFCPNCGARMHGEQDE